MCFEGRQIWVKIYFYPLLVCDYGKPDKLTQVLLALSTSQPCCQNQNQVMHVLKVWFLLESIFLSQQEMSSKPIAYSYLFMK